MILNIFLCVLATTVLGNSNDEIQSEHAASYLPRFRPFRSARDRILDHIAGRLQHGPPLPPLPRLPVSVARIPATGPCILNENDHFKCTDQGYYEMVQCDKNSCFCVNTNNGAKAHGTRTSSSRTVPNCSECYKQLKSLYARGSPVHGTFIPKCDNGLGDFEPVQCDSRNEYCHCVDVKTGREIPGTRQRKENNRIINCDRQPASTAKATTVTPFSPDDAPIGQPSCKLESDRGHRCSSSTAKVMYYFDYEKFTCLAFEHLGCGGNDNKYYTKSECISSCMLVDWMSCAGRSPPAVDRKGEAINCGFTPQPRITTPRPAGIDKDGCPSGYKCLIGAFSGFCCDKKNEERYHKAYHPKCPRGSPFSDSSKGYEEILFGKKCSDNFCPRNYTCKSGDIFAYCCPR